MRVRSLVLSVVVTLAACGGLHRDHVVTGTIGAWRGPIDIVMESAPQPAVAAEVGMVRAMGWGNQANLTAVIDGLRAEAALLGANAVIRVRIDQGTTNVSAVGMAVVLAR